VAVEAGESSQALFTSGRGGCRDCVPGICCAIMRAMDLLFPLAARQLGD
jgi:hypothetical protein